MLRRYPDAIRTFVSILNFILRMRQYHTRSYQYDQVRVFSLVTIDCGIQSSGSDQQNCRSYVRPFCDLQCPLSHPGGRQHSEYGERAIWRAIRQDVSRVRCNPCSTLIQSFMRLIEKRVSQHLRSFSSTHAPNSFLPILPRMRILISLRDILMNLQLSLLSVICLCSYRTCARSLQCPRCAAS